MAAWLDFVDQVMNNKNLELLFYSFGQHSTISW